MLIGPRIWKCTSSLKDVLKATTLCQSVEMERGVCEAPLNGDVLMLDGLRPSDGGYEESLNVKVKMTNPESHVDIKVKCRVGFAWNDPSITDESLNLKCGYNIGLSGHDQDPEGRIIMYNPKNHQEAECVVARCRLPKSWRNANWDTNGEIVYPSFGLEQEESTWKIEFGTVIRKICNDGYIIYSPGKVQVACEDPSVPIENLGRCEVNLCMDSSLCPQDGSATCHPISVTELNCYCNGRDEILDMAKTPACEIRMPTECSLSPQPCSPGGICRPNRYRQVYPTRPYLQDMLYSCRCYAGFSGLHCRKQSATPPLIGSIIKKDGVVITAGQYAHPRSCIEFLYLNDNGLVIAEGFCGTDTVFVTLDSASGRGECRYFDVPDNELEGIFLGDDGIDLQCSLNAVDAEGRPWNMDILPVV